MDRQQRIIALSQKDMNSRKEALENILNDAGLVFTTQKEESSYNNPLGICNYIIDLANDTPALLFSAHFDAVAGSTGANDNAASVCILIDLALHFKELSIPARFVFFDGEENKCAGSKFFVDNFDRSLITGAINLDLCGFGDTITIYTHNKKTANSTAIEPFLNKSILTKYNVQLVNYLPKSDDYTLSSAKIPTLGISVMPHFDVAFLKPLSSYDNGIIGKPPEYALMIDQMEVSTTMHGGYRDDPKWLEDSSMDNVYNYLVNAISTPVEKSQKRFGFFRK